MSGNCVGHLRMGAEPDFEVVPVDTVSSERLPSAVSLGPNLRGRLRPRESRLSWGAASFLAAPSTAWLKGPQNPLAAV